MATYLTKEQAQKLVDNYKNTVKEGKPTYNIKGQEVTDQTKWVWFPKWQLQKVLDAFETSRIEEDEQGIKFYFGVYGDEPVREPIAPYVGLITLLMVPSYKTDEGIVDYNGGEAKLLSDDEIGAENNGKMCPPECNDGSGDDF